MTPKERAEYLRLKYFTLCKTHIGGDDVKLHEAGRIMAIGHVEDVLDSSNLIRLPISHWEDVLKELQKPL